MSRRSRCARNSRRLRAPLALGAAGLALALAPGAALAAPSATVAIADVADRPLATADTIDAGSMTVANTSTAGETITSVTLDLRERPREAFPPDLGWPQTCDGLAELGHICEGPALLPDLAFDPEGGAGDLPGKPLTLDSATGTIGFTAPPEYTFPVGQGFGAVTATFPVDVQPNDAPDDFDAGAEATFSFDVDPTSIQGAPAGAAAGRIAGAELHGASVSITFSDGTTLTNDLALIAGSETDVRAVLAPGGGDQIDAPRLTRPFAATRQGATHEAEQTVGIRAPLVNGHGVLVVAETFAEPTGAPGEEAAPDSLASNSAATFTEIPFTLDEHGYTEVTVTLTDDAGGDPAPDVSGVNVITAHLTEGPEIGKVSRPLVLRLNESLETDPPGIVSVEPAANVSEARVKGVAFITFDEPMDADTVRRSPVHPPFDLESGVTLNGSYSAVVPVEGSGGRTFAIHPYHVIFGRPTPPPPLGAGQYTVTVSPNVFDVHGNALGEEVSTTVTLAPDPVVDDPIPTEPDPPGSHQPPPPPPAPAVRTGEPVCAPVPARPAGGQSDTIRLEAAQLLIGQRIAQAAVRRANAVEAWLEAGIVAGDLCGNDFGPADFQGVSWIGGATNPPATPTPRPIEVAAAPERREGDVTLSAAQLLINQRISQAAVRRVDALIARIDGGLTGGDLADGALGARSLWTGLRAQSTTAATPVAKSRTVVAERGGGGGKVSVSAAQLRINQRISQAAVRRVNALIDRLQRGLTGADFRDGSLTAADLATEVRPG